MEYISRCKSPLGEILLSADGAGLTGLWFEGQKYYARGLDADCAEKETEIFKRTKRWLDIYFSGKEPDFTPPLSFIGTDFQKAVWEILTEIPYGKIVTYAAVAKEIAARRGTARMSARAVGGAVSRNRISVIVPCHRVAGANGSLTGYAGGIDKKIRLLELEGADMSGFFAPNR